MASRKRVLVVGDPGQSVLSSLTAVGYELSFATCSEAPRTAAAWQPSVILVDPALMENPATFVDAVRWCQSVLVVAISSGPQDPGLIMTVDICLEQPADVAALHEMLTAWPAQTKTTRRSL